MGILSLAGLESDEAPRPKARSKRSSRPNPRAEVSKPKWGTPEEKYRRLCMLALLCRYAYYHHATSVVDDQLYDLLEATILKIEDQNRAMIHPRSPTVRVGSSREEDYPRSVRDIWERHEDDPKLLVPIGKAVRWFLEDATAEFGV